MTVPAGAGPCRSSPEVTARAARRRLDRSQPVRPAWSRFRPHRRPVPTAPPARQHHLPGSTTGLAETTCPAAPPPWWNHLGGSTSGLAEPPAWRRHPAALAAGDTTQPAKPPEPASHRNQGTTRTSGTTRAGFITSTGDATNAGGTAGIRRRQYPGARPIGPHHPASATNPGACPPVRSAWRAAAGRGVRRCRGPAPYEAGFRAPCSVPQGPCRPRTRPWPGPRIQPYPFHARAALPARLTLCTHLACPEDHRHHGRRASVDQRRAGSISAASYRAQPVASPMLWYIRCAD